jgi:hypothetical protein
VIARRETGFGVVPVSRVGLNSILLASRGRVPGVLSLRRLGAAAAGVGVAALAIAGQVSRQARHGARSVWCAACRLDGIRACTFLELAC